MSELEILLSDNSRNPNFPPKLDSNIIAKLPNKKGFFIGKVVKNILNNTSSIIFLFNQRDYLDPSLEINKITDKKGLLLLLPAYGWTYLTKDIKKLLLKYNEGDDLNAEAINNYRDMISRIEPEKLELQLGNKQINVVSSQSGNVLVQDDRVPITNEHVFYDPAMEKKIRNSAENPIEKKLLTKF